MSRNRLWMLIREGLITAFLAWLNSDSDRVLWYLCFKELVDNLIGILMCLWQDLRVCLGTEFFVKLIDELIRAIDISVWFKLFEVI